jgi:hypothetical protein
MQSPLVPPVDHQPGSAAASSLSGQGASLQLQVRRLLSRTQDAGGARPTLHGIAGGGGPLHSFAGQARPGSQSQIGGFDAVHLSVV